LSADRAGEDHAVSRPYPESDRLVYQCETDKVSDMIFEDWQRIPEQRFQDIVLAFGQYRGDCHGIILYFIDNEIHHRGQGTVYLRSLGIEPPAFWNRD
jgi:uncharacterized damage-inducible protein DinB